MLFVPSLLFLLASPTVEMGAGLGGGLLDAQPTALVRPWLGLRITSLELEASLQAPLRFELPSGRLRPRDWDEHSDYARIVRFIRVKDLLRVGTLSELSLGHGSLVRRYHNGVDDDHARAGLWLRLGESTQGLALEAFADHFLAPPVSGGRLSYPLLGGQFVLAASVAADTQEGPVSPRPVGYGVDLSWFLDDPQAGLYSWADLNRLHDRGQGLHLGLGYRWRTPSLRIHAASEWLLTSAGYEWALFDTTWLIERHREPFAHTQTGGHGARSQFDLDWGGALRVGVEYAFLQNPANSRRNDLSVWAHVALEPLILRASWHMRRFSWHERPLGGSPMGAATLAYPFLESLWLTFTAARTWRPTADELSYAPSTDLLLALEAAFGVE